MKSFLVATVAAGALLGSALPASANLVYLANMTLPAGVGNSNVILSLQSPNNTTTETGSVTPGPTCTGDTQPACGNPSNNVISFQSAGATSAANVRIFLDAQEPDNSITVNSLTMQVYTAAGVAIPGASYSLAAPVTLTTCPGQGINCVNVFALDAAQALDLQNNHGAFNTSWLVGLSASLSSATGGPDRFILGNGTSGPGLIPEPVSLSLLAAGLIGLGAAGMRRKV